MQEKEFVDSMLYVFKAPIITWPRMEDTLTEEMKAKVNIERLLAVAKGLGDECTDYEAMLYLMSASMANPFSHTWVKIYGWLFKKFYPQNQNIMEELENPTEWELKDLAKLKQWIYKKQMEHIKEKRKGETKTRKTVEQDIEQVTFPLIAT